MNKKKLKVPNSFVIISSILVLVAALTWIIPAGEYDTHIIDNREVVVQDSYHQVESNPQGVPELLKAPINGFIEAALIIGFVLIVGGVFSVFQKTKALEILIINIANLHESSRIVRIFLIPIFMVLFSIGGSVFGMGEEVIPFILVFVPLSLMIGYDSIVGIAIPFVGAGAGFAGAFLNPFTIGIAQGIAELPPFSGIEYRIIVWIICTTIAVLFVMRYAKKVKENPNLSLTYEQDLLKRKNYSNKDRNERNAKINKTHLIVLSIFSLSMIVLVFGVIKYEWFIKEICALFLITGVIVGMVGKLSLDEITKAFIEGAKDLIGTALIIALARSILVVAKDGKIIDTILFYTSNLVKDFHPIISSQLMFFLQSFLNFFIPSGSGQAALTMPILAPLGDLIGVSRQTVVLAFQFGDGFSNMIIPTSAITMGVLSLAEVPWEKWARWMFPLFLIFISLSLLLLIIPFFINWQ